jgi:hypothetical protein
MSCCEDCGVSVVDERLCEGCFDQWLSQAIRGGK